MPTASVDAEAPQENRVRTLRARARSALSRLNPAVDEYGIRLALGTISDLANDHALTVYDAVYLELAIRRRLPLASLDAALNRVARLYGVKTLL